MKKCNCGKQGCGYACGGLEQPTESHYDCNNAVTGKHMACTVNKQRLYQTIQMHVLV